MHALIDADRFAYSIGGLKNDAGDPLEWNFVRARIDANIYATQRATGAEKITLFLTPADQSNFRIALATIRAYKGQRPSEKPFWYDSVRQYILLTYPCVMEDGIEADDAIGIAATSFDRDGWEAYHKCKVEGTFSITPAIDLNCVICSVDKDLNNIPGYHYNEIYSKDGLYWVSEIDSLRNFYCQLLVGDRVDNIGGLYGVGGKSKLLADIHGANTELDMFVHVRSLYEKYFGSYWKMFLWENASLLWIKRSRELPGEKEVQERLEKLLLEASALEVA